MHFARAARPRIRNWFRTGTHIRTRTHRAQPVGEGAPVEKSGTLFIYIHIRTREDDEVSNSSSLPTFLPTDVRIARERGGLFLSRRTIKRQRRCTEATLLPRSRNITAL
ncbi:hypothetical protein PUN28_017557 [Cardiocondyla obscurior]|uniref:Uncharacterized protein n=1 Tax=Cardiocondyla obscurior TaxID=286306 RepID=A0AAW2ENF2_9HYME